MTSISQRVGILNWRLAFVLFAAAVLAFPAIAMQFSSEMNWGAEDFAAAGAILFTVWLAIEISLRAIPAGIGRFVALAVVVLAVLAVWAQLAVGII